MTEGSEEKKETEVQLGQRENPALAPAHVLECVERRFAPFLKCWCHVCVCRLQSNVCHAVCGVTMMPENILKVICPCEGLMTVTVLSEDKSNDITQMNTRGSCRAFNFLYDFLLQFLLYLF